MLPGDFSFFDPFSIITSDLADNFIGPVCFFCCLEPEVWVLPGLDSTLFPVPEPLSFTVLFGFIFLPRDGFALSVSCTGFALGSYEDLFSPL